MSWSFIFDGMPSQRGVLSLLDVGLRCFGRQLVEDFTVPGFNDTVTHLRW